MLIDTHCHLTHERYRVDLPEVLRRAREAGVGGIVAIASDLEDAVRVRTLLEAEGTPDGEGPELWGTAGVHPHEAAGAPTDLRARLIPALDAHPRIVAVGECGLDHHYDLASRSVQRRVFAVHLDVAAERDLPVVVHCREAEEEMRGFVREAGEAGVRGVLHCFPGDPDLLDAALEAGWLVSFTGIVTFRSYEGIAAVRRVPAAAYMLETDGPYLAPVPRRGKRNEPAYVTWVRDRVAELREEEPGEVERAATEAARRFFGLSGPGGA